MERLNKDWITEKHIDFEYKKYVLLAWLQHVDECFRANRLYPPLAELVEHYRMARQLKENKQQLDAQFPRALTGFDPVKFRLNYQRVITDDKLMSEIENILDFSLPKFEEWLHEGKQICEFIEKTIALESIGLMPIDTSAGYLFLQNPGDQTRVYSYAVTIFEEANAGWRGIHTQFVRSYTQSITHTYEWIKNELLHQYPAMPNPACYAAETGLKIPVEETFLPIAKRMLIREVSKN